MRAKEQLRTWPGKSDQKLVQFFLRYPPLGLLQSTRTDFGCILIMAYTTPFQLLQEVGRVGQEFVAFLVSSACLFKFNIKEKLEEVEDSPLRLISFPQENPRVGVDASPENFKLQDMLKTDGERDLFDELKRRFLNFKKEKFLKQRDHFRILAEYQSPKFMVIACVDSRVCPSNILGFQPGEAFMIRNVANLVPALENGPTETNAALEFAVNTLEVEHILVIGHSSCAGIQALMTMQDGRNSSFVEKWVAFAKVAKLRTKSEAANLSFHEQCRHCEKESINNSLVNLLSYPWIEERVRKGLVCIHGGYYDFLECTFEKWTLDWKGSSIGESSRTVLVKDRVLWC